MSVERTDLFISPLDMREDIGQLKRRIALMQPVEQDLICSVNSPFQALKVKIRYKEGKGVVHPSVYVVPYGAPEEVVKMMLKMFPTEFLHSAREVLQETLDHIQRTQDNTLETLLKLKDEPKARESRYSTASMFRQPHMHTSHFSVPQFLFKQRPMGDE